MQELTETREWALEFAIEGEEENSTCEVKMVRAPCCEKMGLKKGPWTPEEDQILVSYIQQHGHGNWRALPKHAGNYIHRFILLISLRKMNRHPMTVC